MWSSSNSPRQRSVRAETSSQSSSPPAWQKTGSAVFLRSSVRRRRMKLPHSLSSHYSCFPPHLALTKAKSHERAVDINNPVCQVILLGNGVRRSLATKGSVISHFIDLRHHSNTCTRVTVEESRKRIRGECLISTKIFHQISTPTT